MKQYTPTILFHFIPLVGLLAGGTYASGDPSAWTLCTHELELIEALVIQADESEVIIIDDFGIRKSKPTDTLFFMTPNARPISSDEREEPEEVSGFRSIALDDGQVITGKIMDSSDDDYLSLNIIAQDTPRGDASIALEDILWISREPGNINGQWSPEMDSDFIVTTNDDVLRGFVEAIGSTTSIDAGDGVLDLELAQTQTIGLANIPEPIDGIYINTVGELRLRVARFDFDFQHPLSVTIDADSLGLTSDARETWLLDPISVVGLEMIDSSHRVISLGSIEPELVEPTGGRDWTPTPTVLDHPSNPILSTIDLHAPVRVVYRLPTGASRFACELLAPGNTWTDCIASVYAISYTGQRTELVSQRLNSEHPRESLNVILDQDTQKIEIRIDPGEHGPIQDRVLVEHPRVLIGS